MVLNEDERSAANRAIELSPGGVGFVRTAARKDIGGDATGVDRLVRPAWLR